MRRGAAEGPARRVNSEPARWTEGPSLGPNLVARLGHQGSESPEVQVAQRGAQGHDRHGQLEQHYKEPGPEHQGLALVALGEPAPHPANDLHGTSLSLRSDGREE